MELTTAEATSCDPFAEAVRARARAEWVEWAAALQVHEEEETAVRDGGAEGPRLQAELSFIPTDMAQRVHWSEGQIQHRVAQARRVRDKTPTVWQAFSEGRIDGPKSREIASAIDRLERAESIARLDHQVVGYAEKHTLAETRRWLKLFVARVESDLFTERANRAREDRGVDVFHVPAVDKRLTKEAKAFGADDPRTLQQRRADLFAAWMTTNEAREAAVNAEIAVTIPGSAIAGADSAPAVAADGGWVVCRPSGCSSSPSTTATVSSGTG